MTDADQPGRNHNTATPTGEQTADAPSRAELDARTEIEARYGRTPARAARTRLVAWIVGLGFVAVFAAWVVWVAFDGTSATIDARDIGHSIIDDSTVTVSFEVSMAAGTRAECALQVQNEQHAIVGWKIVDIPASEKYTQSMTETVRSTELGVTGLLYRCWPA
ncbi:uncharacterized protein DUF4307 [Homoserinimonas aerilata]|uniref:Uncharacterized protein DUF4307 n=1 Tax=Homoserinimonas aerilata TaxID=1162970 RepID=A0A542YGS4_9MICO|nr:DUF4307 domain-containing protein [Homoserinimonas aerilata]TQL47287.1 uncharacterized protein DUF4307 [Homoserinimonas aerilata]